MKQYLDLLRHIKDNGTHKPAAREGMPGTKSIFGYQFRHNLADGLPLLTTKKMFWKGIVVELLWFLRGDTNIKYLLDHGVNIWNEDAYNYYCKKVAIFDKQFFNNERWIQMDFEEFIKSVKDSTVLSSIPGYALGDCGHQYGKVWRKWEKFTFVADGDGNDCSHRNKDIDQIKNLINSLKNTPESRRHILTAIDPAHENDLALYWCHALVQFNCRPLSAYDRYKWAKNNIGQHLIDSYHLLESDPPRLRDRLDELNVPKYYLDCQLYQRSADVVLGVPFNIASYALLTHILCEICNMVPGEFVHTFGDVHIYDNHMEAVEEQLKREPMVLPKLHVFEKHPSGTYFDHVEKYLVGRYDLDDFISHMTIHDFRIEGYAPLPPIKAELSTGLKK